MNLSSIREQMKVVGSDRKPVGTVDHIEGDEIKLAKNDPQSGGQHHYIPSDWIEKIENDQVRLNKSSTEACAQWRVD
jgi:hypothetical protein